MVGVAQRKVSGNKNSKGLGFEREEEETLLSGPLCFFRSPVLLQLDLLPYVFLNKKKMKKVRNAGCS